MAEQTTVVMPCYNEAARLNTSALAAFLETTSDISLLLVDDGSSDGTAKIIEEFATTHPGRAQALVLKANVGKAEAVRQGMLQALPSSDFVGFLDADLATRPVEMLAMRQLLHDCPEADWIFGSRVKLLGRRVERNELRHLLGRAFATAVSLTLHIPVYDTQCGAKLFRVNSDLEQTLATRFNSRWIFDVEMIERLIACCNGDRSMAACRIIEMPLEQWIDIAGSKVTAGAFIKATRELAGIAWRLRKTVAH